MATSNQGGVIWGHMAGKQFEVNGSYNKSCIVRVKQLTLWGVSECE